MSKLSRFKKSEKRILIADDDIDILESMQLMLEMEGYKVEATPEGKNVTRMSRKHPDLLVLDTWMSGYDGRDICRNIKSSIFTRNIPVIMISASDEVEKSAIDSGADDFIAKPFQIEEILNKVEKHLAVN